MIDMENDVTTTSSGIMQIDDIAYMPEAKAIFMMDEDTDAFEEPLSTIQIGNYRIVPRGDTNNQPEVVLKKIKHVEVVAQNLNFKIATCYAQGVKPMIRIKDGDKFRLEECEDEKVNNFFEDNDIKGYFQEQCSDVQTFQDIFPEIVLTKDLKSIYSLRSKESTFSRWGVCDSNTGQIVKHFYSAGWHDGTANESNTVVTDVLNRYNPYQDLVNRIQNRKVSVPRFILQCSPQQPGKLYYQTPAYWAIFRSGWYDVARMIPAFKKALIKNGLSVRYIFYVSKKYWENIFREEKIDTNDIEKVKARKTEELERFRNFLSNAENSGKGLMAVKEMIAAGSSAVEEKYITVESIKVDIKGGEFLEDASEVHSILSYGMGVQSSLVASSFGKSSSNISGTDKRELFMINSALMQPTRDKLLRPFYLIKRFNNWPANLVFVVPDYDFTSLDNNKSGKELKTTSNASN